MWSEVAVAVCLCYSPPLLTYHQLSLPLPLPLAPGSLQIQILDSAQSIIKA